MGRNLSEAIDNAGRTDPLDPEKMDLEVRNPAGVAKELGHVIAYEAGTENQVAKDVDTIRGLLPRLNVERARFVDEIWAPQELAHGRVLGAILEQINVPVPRLTLQVSPVVKVLGSLSRHSEGLERVLNTFYSMSGALNEQTAAQAYKRTIRHCSKMGEPALKGAFGKILAQEGPHLEVYRKMTEETWTQMSEKEKRITRWLLADTFTPVGTSARGQESREDFGMVSRTLLDDNEQISHFMSRVLGLTDELMGDKSGKLKNRIVDEVVDCINLSKRRQAKNKAKLAA